MDKERTIEVTREQAIYLKRNCWAVAVKEIGGKWFVYLMLIGGKTERFVKKYLKTE